jgi:hypothetical protein
VQRVLDHAHKNTDGLRCANQSLNGIGCVFKVNTGDFEEPMELIVVDATQRCSNPNQVSTPANMVFLASVAANDAFRLETSACDLHESPSIV